MIALAFVLAANASSAVPEDARLLLNQKRMEIRQLVEMVSKETGRTILLDEQVRGMVSLVSKRPVTGDEAWEILDSALHLLGFALLPSTVDQWRIGRIADAIGESPVVASPRRDSDRYVTALIPLEVAGLQSVMNVIQPLAGSATTLVAHEDTNSIIASGPESVIARLTGIADELDFVEERALRQRVLRYRGVLDVEDMIQAQFESGRFSDRELELWSDERTNSLIFRGAPEAVDRLIGFLERIDVPDEGQGEIRVLRVLHRDAGEIAQILGGQVPGAKRSSDSKTSKDDRERERETGSDDGGSDDARARETQDDDDDRSARTSGGTSSRFGGPNAAPEDFGGLPTDPTGAAAAAAGAPLDLRALLGGEDHSIAVDEATRSLVVRASPRGHEIIRALVEELDARPQLIAVDVTVSQLRTPSSWGLALSYHVPLLPGDALDEFVGRLISLPAGGGFRTSPVAQGALFGRVSRDAGVDFEIPGEGGVSIPIEDTGMIDATDRRFVSEVLIQPSLVIVAGEHHEIFVGANIPVPVSDVSSLGNIDPTNPTTGGLGVRIDFNRQDIGIRLGLDARAGREGPIQLAIETEISDVAPSIAGSIEEVGPTLIKQVLNARATLDDGETAILGVDQERRESRARGGTPWLSDIPFLGWFFKARGNQTDDLRLVIAARARRISTPAELVADSIRRRLAFDRQSARESNLPPSGGSPFGVRVTTRSLEADAVAIAEDLERRGHVTRVHRWQGVDRSDLYDVYVMGLDTLVDAGDLAYQLGADGWDADLVVFASRS